MRKLVKAATIIILGTVLFSNCVVKKDTAASAATSAALAKKIAQGLSTSGTASAPASIQPGAPSAAVALNCTYPTVSGYSLVLSCTSDSFDLYWAMASDTTISGYDKFKNYAMTESSQNYQINGQINFTGSSSSSVSANYTVVTINSNMTFNGTLAVSGADSFSVTYKNYKINTVGTYTTSTASYQYSQTCSGTLTVDSIDYTIQADCSIAK